MTSRFVSLSLLLTLATSAISAIREQTVLYREGGTVMEGTMVYDPQKGKRPCVLVVHDWNGPDAYELGRARQLAALGYTAMVVDIYGRGVRPKNNQESAAESGKYGKDRRLTRKRIMAAYNYASRQPWVDGKRIAAIGYCFGGMVVLELARMGAPARGVASFHGNLSNPNPAEARFIKSQVLVLHGAADPLVPKAQVAAFEKEMKAAKKPFKLVAYPGAVHSFSLKHAGNDPKTGVAYNAEADKKSWAELQSYLKRLFR
jgi:dienelactone hydrolase